MTAVDLETRTEKDVAADEVPAPRISWDPSVSAIPLGFGWDAEAVVVDWYGRGQPDLLVTAAGGQRGRVARIYRPTSPGEGSLPRYDAGETIGALDGLRCVCAIPNGAKSRFDLVALGSRGLVWLPNQGESQRPQWGDAQLLGVPADLGIGPSRIVQIVAEDWDGDGLTDLLVGANDLTGYWPDSDRLPIAEQVGFNQKGGHPGYDRTGLWRGQAPRGRLFWLRNVGRPGAPAFEVQPEIIGESGPLGLGLRPAGLTVSWGGGKAVELLLTDDRRVVRVYRNFGGQRPPVLLEPRELQSGHGPLLLPDDRTSLVAADLDGDRRAELVYGTADGKVFAIRAGMSRNDAKMPEPILQENPAIWLGGNSVVTVGDLDGDGDLDIVFGDGCGVLHYVEDLGNAGDHRYAAPVPIESGGAPFRVDPGPDGMREGPASPRLGYACPTLVDWTGNGRLGLIVGGAGGEILYLRNDGATNSPRFGAPAPLRCDGGPLIVPPRVRPAAVDWNGKGLIDLIALDLQGFLCVYPRAGTNDLGPPVPLVDRLGRVLRLDGSYGQSGLCSLWAGPWTGSGLPDLLVGLPRGNRHVVAALSGLPLENLDDLSTVLLLENLGHGRVAAKPLRHTDGRPVIVGVGGCSPCGVDASGRGALDLLVGSDDGHLTLLRREDLRW